MYLKTGKEFTRDIADLKINVLAGDRKIDSITDHPLFAASMRTLANTYDLQHEQETKDLFLARSHISTDTIARWTHIPQNVNDMISAVDLVRHVVRKTGNCSLRCMNDFFGAVLLAARRTDDRQDTNYFENAIDYIRYFQKNDLTGCAVVDNMTDRGSALAVTKKDKDGITLNGTRLVYAGPVCSHERLIMPGHTSPECAVCCAVPSNAHGLKHVIVPGTRSCDGAGTAILVFEDVFVPRERVFMYGENTAMLTALAVDTHTPAACALASGLADILIGTIQAEHASMTQSVKEKIAWMLLHSESSYSAAIATAIRSQYHEDIGMIPDTFLAAGARHASSKAISEFRRLREELDGPEQDLHEVAGQPSSIDSYLRLPEGRTRHNFISFEMINICRNYIREKGNPKTFGVSMYEHAIRGDALSSRLADAKSLIENRDMTEPQ